MKFDIVYSSNKIDATDAQIDAMGEGLNLGKRELVIVPDKYAQNTTEQILDRLGIESTFDIEVTTLSQLYSSLVMQQTAAEISSLDASIIIKGTLLEHERELLSFADTPKTISFAGNLYSAITLLQSCNITPSDLRQANDTQCSQALANKIHDIALIYDYYDQCRAGKFIDSSDRLTLLTEAIGRTDYQNTDVHFCYFDSLTDKECLAVAQFIRVANRVTFGVLRGNPGQANAELYQDALVTKLQKIATEMSVTPTATNAKQERTEVTQHIINNLLAVTPAVMELPDSDTVRIYEAGNPRIETEWVATDIINKIKAGARYRDFAISCADLNSYQPIIKKIFADYGIPVFIDAPFPLAATEAAKLVQAAVTFANGGHQVKDAYRFIDNALSGWTQSERELYQNVTTTYGLTGERLCDTTRPKNNDSDFIKFLELSQKLSPLFDFCEMVADAKTLGEYVDSVNKLLNAVDAKRRLELLANKMLASGDAERSSIIAQSYKKLDAVLTQICGAEAMVECEFGEFCQMLENAVSEASITATTQSIDCVYVGQSVGSVFAEVDNLYLMCAIEGNLPQFTSDVGLIADDDITALKISVPTVREANAYSRQAAITSFAVLRKKLVVTYPKNMNDAECVPANVVTSLQNIFAYNGRKLPIINLNYLLGDKNAFGSERNLLAHTCVTEEAMLSRYLSGLHDPLANQGAQRALRQVLNKNHAPLLAQIDEIKSGKKTVEGLADAEALFFAESKAGVTQIEKFFDCPYAHFLTYGIKLKQKKTSKIEAVDTGNILHAVLENFGKLLRERGTVDDAEIKPFVAKTFDYVLGFEQYEHIVFGGNNKVRLDALKSEAVRACEAVNYQMSHTQYKIKFIESKFGTEGFVPVPEIAIINTDKKIKISGKIDRADVCGNRLRIIDYKTSKNSADFKLLNFYLGKKIQLFYYLAVVLKNLGMQPGGAYYLPVHKEYTEDAVKGKHSAFCMQGIALDDPVDALRQDDQINFDNSSSDIVCIDISTKKEYVGAGQIVIKTKTKASEAEFINMQKYAVDVLSGAINDIYSGVIEPSHLPHSCEYCKYASICRAGVLVEDKERSDAWKIDNAKVFDFEEK